VLWDEIVGILAPDLFIAMHDALIDLHHVASLDVNGALAVFASAKGQRCVLETVANLHDTVGIEAMCWKGKLRLISNESLIMRRLAYSRSAPHRDTSWCVASRT
jgi:hypothetical protein